MDGGEPILLNLSLLTNLSNDKSFSLPILDFALSVDEILPQCLNNRIEHICRIVQQVFQVNIQSHRMFDILSIIKQKSAHGNNMLRHGKNLEHELLKYSSDLNNLHHYPMSTPFCLPFVIAPQSDQCPQYVYYLISQVATLYDT